MPALGNNLTSKVVPDGLDFATAVTDEPWVTLSEECPRLRRMLSRSTPAAFERVA